MPEELGDEPVSPELVYHLDLLDCAPPLGHRAAAGKAGRVLLFLPLATAAVALVAAGVVADGRDRSNVCEGATLAAVDMWPIEAILWVHLCTYFLFSGEGKWRTARKYLPTTCAGVAVVYVAAAFESRSPAASV